MCSLYCKPEDIGLASGFLGSAKQIAGTIATAIYIAILNNQIAANLPRDVSAAALDAGLPESSLTDLVEAASAGNDSTMEAVPGITNDIIAAVSDVIKTAYSQSVSTIFLASIAFGGASFITALFSVSVDDKLDDIVAAKLSHTGDRA
ncbi:hypothetical protein MW887_007356 [Aspergillus wentii]|nr:hypothetical protein MW887_007356 [Aspergillus wentii]